MDVRFFITSRRAETPGGGGDGLGGGIDISSIPGGEGCGNGEGKGVSGGDGGKSGVGGEFGDAI